MNIGILTHLSHVCILRLPIDASHLQEVEAPNVKEFHNILERVLTDLVEEFDCRFASVLEPVVSAVCQSEPRLAELVDGLSRTFEDCHISLEIVTRNHSIECCCQLLYLKLQGVPLVAVFNF